MQAQSTIPLPARRSKLKVVGIIAAVAAIIGTIAFKVAQQRSDGPLNDMLPGGALRSGALVTEPVDDWQFANGKTIELQLETPLRSRYTGLMVHNGELYVPCDLGFMWGRFSGTTRHMLHLIYRFKRWHEDALADGRVLFRIDDKRYARNAVRVTEPGTVTALKAQLEDMAREWVAPDTLGPPPTSGPRDIWFFRLDPRTIQSL